MSSDLKNKNLIYLIAVVLVVVLILSGVYYFALTQKQKPIAQPPAPKREAAGSIPQEIIDSLTASEQQESTSTGIPQEIIDSLTAPK